MRTVLFQAENIETFYGHSQALFGMDLTVRQGEVVTLMGRNGMGKTTTVRSIMGLTRAASGSICMEGRELRGLPPFAVARAGLALVPEGRQVFPNLTVLEHFIIAEKNPGGRPTPWTAKRVFDLFPSLEERRQSFGNQLSGGEQQMLAIGRALVTNPKLLILDEATEGLAPLVRQQIWDCIEALKRTGLSILVIDKSVDELTRLGDHHVIIEKGRVAWQGNSVALKADLEIQHRFLGV